MAQQHTPTEGVRLDKWLWAARFFKTRSIAQAAINAGKVYVDNIRAKPGRSVKLGQEIAITTARGRYTVLVEKLSASRGSATVAMTLYKETQESKQAREHLSEMRRLADANSPSERPNSQERRLLRRLKEGDCND